MPHIQQMVPEYEGKPVAFISINTRNPKGQVDAEMKRFIKRYKLTYPYYYGRGQDINRDFQVKVLPRLILVRSDKTVYKDVAFMKADELKVEIDKLLSELPQPEQADSTGSK